MERIREERLHRTTGAKVLFGVIFAVLAVYAASVLFTMVWCFYNSLKTTVEFHESYVALPKFWKFSNFGQAFKLINYNGTSFIGMFINSIWFAGGMTLLSVFMNCVTGYVFSKYKFFGREAAFGFILFTIAFPIVGALPSFYKIVLNLGMMDSPLFLLTALGGFGGNFLIMYAFFKNISWSYAEAAQIDGANDLYIFFRIMMPLAAGPVFALTILGFVGQWNNYETPLLFLNSYTPLSSGLYRFWWIARYTIISSAETIYLAGVLLSVIPVIILVSIFGGKIMQNVSMGGLKG